MQGKNIMYLIPQLKYTPADVYCHPDIDLLVSYYSFLDLRHFEKHPFSNNNLLMVFTSRDRGSLVTFKDCMVNYSDDNQLEIEGNLIMHKVEHLEHIDGHDYYKTTVLKANVRFAFNRMKMNYIDTHIYDAAINISNEEGDTNLDDNDDIIFLLSSEAELAKQVDQSYYDKIIDDFVHSVCIIQYDPMDDHSIMMPSRQQFLSYSSRNSSFYKDYYDNLSDMQAEIERVKKEL